MSVMTVSSGRRRSALLAAVAVIATGCTSTPPAARSSTPKVNSASLAGTALGTGNGTSTGTDTGTVIGTAGTAPGPASAAAPTGSAVAATPPAPVTHAPVGMVTALKNSASPVWTVTYPQLVPDAHRPEASQGLVRLVLAAPTGTTYLVLASAATGQDDLLFGISAVASYQPPQHAGTTVVFAPSALVTPRLVFVGSHANGRTVLGIADGRPEKIAGPDTFGGVVDSAGRIAGTDGEGDTGYWTADGQLLMKHAGKPVDVPVFDRAPPLYFFLQQVGNKRSVVAVHPDGSTAWQSPHDTVAGYCAGVYVLRTTESTALTGVDASGKVKWTAKLPGHVSVLEPKVTCATGEVISVTNQLEGTQGTLTVLDAASGRVKLALNTLGLPELDTSSGHLIITGTLTIKGQSGLISALAKYR